MTQPADTGYVQDVAFRSGVVPGQAPAAIRLSSLATGHLPPTNETFTYVDLGCGEGTTLVALAALYPRARFFGVDFNAEHVATAQAAIAALGLENAQVLEAPFTALSNLDLPERCEFIAINGIYGWLDPVSAAAVDACVGSRLAEGGVFYVEYLASPGKIAIAALWRFLQEMTPLAEFGGDARARAEAALDLLERLARRGMAFFQHHPSAIAAARHYLTGKKRDPYQIDHFAHNAMAAHFTPRTFTEIHARFAAQGLGFVARAEIELNDLELMVPPAQVPTFREITDPIRRELLKDFIRNEHDRRDLWGKGVARDEAAALERLVTGFGLLLRSPADKLARQIAAPGGHRIALIGPAFDALIERGYEGVARLTDFPAADRPRLARAMLRLISSGQAWPIVDPDFAPAAPPPLTAEHTHRLVLVHPLNRWLLARSAERLTGCQLVAPATGGMALVLSPLETLLLHAAGEVGIAQAPAAVAERLKGEARHVLTAAGFVAASEVKREELDRLWGEFLGSRAPNLIRLGLGEAA